MRIKVPPKPHVCEDKIELFLRNIWNRQMKKKHLPPVGSVIKCDCDRVFKLQVSGVWEAGEWNWEDPFTGPGSA